MNEKVYDIDNIELAFFNHDSDGSEPNDESWQKRRTEWKSFLAYLKKNEPSNPEQTADEH